MAQPPDFLLDYCLEDIVLARPVTEAATKWINNTFPEPEKIYWEGQLPIHLTDWLPVYENMLTHGLVAQ